MREMMVAGNHVIVEWESERLNIWMRNGDSFIQLSEDNLKTILLMVGEVRKNKWSEYQQKKQKD